MRVIQKWAGKTVSIRSKAWFQHNFLDEPVLDGYLMDLLLLLLVLIENMVQGGQYCLAL